MEFKVKKGHKFYDKAEEFEELYNNYESLFDSIFSGFDVGPGWFIIIADFVVKLDRHLERNPQLDKDRVIIVQIKEKFGSLRIYVGESDYYINCLTLAAEKAAEDACVVCGESTINDFGIGSALCEKHFLLYT